MLTFQSSDQLSNAAMLSQLLSTMNQYVGQGASPANPNLPSSNTAVLMSQAFNAVNQAMSGAYPSSVSSVIGSIAQGMGNEGNQLEEKQGIFVKSNLSL
jgi:hypothetical protein